MHPSVALTESRVEQALANDADRRILAACIRKPLQAKDISRNLDIPLASTYRRIKALVDSGLLTVERSAMTADGKPYDLYRSRIRSANLQLSAHGIDVSWEANAGFEDRVLSLWNQMGN